MFFTVKPYRSSPPARARSQAFLRQDSWNDYSYYTLFYLAYVDDEGLVHDIGGVKIAYFGQGTSWEAKQPVDNAEFDVLEDGFFSLGQDDNYYDRLNQLGHEVREKILNGLRDIANDEALYERAITEEVTKVSLLRGVSQTSVTGQFRRMTRGGARLSEYKFNFTPPVESETAPTSISFHVLPESAPPTNIHVLIGRNGVGKTHLLNNMVKTLVKPEEGPAYGAFTAEDIPETERIFANLISVSFSAFDKSEPLKENIDRTVGIHYSYIGLRKPRGERGEIFPPKSINDLKEEFVASMEMCRKGSKSDLWKMAIELLETDPNFKEAEIPVIMNIADDGAFKLKSSELYDNLSSGHKIVLLTITRLVETMEEKSLVLMDEPETHLHPPLLSAFVRALSQLLIEKNGVAIIVTHSPVVLQEVPKSCVYNIRRNANGLIPERFDAETFGENVGLLTREVFGLEVAESGFHKTLINAIDAGRSYDEMLLLYKGQLGMEARSIIRAHVATNNPGAHKNT
jgi:predicted ATPase